MIMSMRDWLQIVNTGIILSQSDNIAVDLAKGIDNGENKEDVWGSWESSIGYSSGSNAGFEGIILYLD